MATVIYVKEDRRATVRDGNLLGFIGPAVTVEELTETNGWSIQTDLVPSEGGTPHNHAQQRYQSMRAQGLSEVDARAVTGYQGV